ncbi:hypothetical protein [Photobacterium phosphoreum]|nr:hypothetical protein [Photobacterium phosphoreum]
MKLVKEGKYYRLNNPTPYYFAITELKVDGKTIKLENELSHKLGMVSPKSSILLSDIKLLPTSIVVIKAIDDYGAVNEYEVK